MVVPIVCFNKLSRTQTFTIGYSDNDNNMTPHEPWDAYLYHSIICVYNKRFYNNNKAWCTSDRPCYVLYDIS